MMCFTTYYIVPGGVILMKIEIWNAKIYQTRTKKYQEVKSKYLIINIKEMSYLKYYLNLEI